MKPLSYRGNLSGSLGAEFGSRTPEFPAANRLRVISYVEIDIRVRNDAPALRRKVQDQPGGPSRESHRSGGSFGCLRNQRSSP